MSSGKQCNPCNTRKIEKESMASLMDNLIFNLFGEIIRNIRDDGTAEWNTPCDPLTEFPGYPRFPSEGFVCYLIRIMSAVRIRYRGTYSVSETYSLNDVVSGPDGNSLYWAIVDSQGEPLSDTNFWLKVIEGIQGPVGPAGGSDPVWAPIVQTGNYTVGENDQVIYFRSLTGDATATLPDPEDQPGKWYSIVLDSENHSVIIATAEGEINGYGSTVTLSVRHTAVTLHSDGTNWNII